MLEIISLSEVAKKYNKTEAQVRYAISQNRLKAIKIGWQWCFVSDELPKSWPETPRAYKRKLRGSKD